MQGFTLIEIMVVLLILAISLSVITLALPNSETQNVEREADRFRWVLEDNVATRRSFCLKALKREGAAKCIPFHTIVLELNAFTMVVQRSSESTGKAKGC